MSKGIFITATGTGVGKTFISGLIFKKLCACGYRASYYKPVASEARERDGELIPDDVSYVISCCVTLPSPTCVAFSYAYKPALSPHLAGELEKRPVDVGKIMNDFNALSQNYPYLVVEGCGGVVCPIRYDKQKKLFLTDIIRQLNLPVLVVANASLGSINSSVLTVEYLKQQKIHIRGIVVNRYHDNRILDKNNVCMIRELTQVPIIAQVCENACDLPMTERELLSVFE